MRFYKRDPDAAIAGMNQLTFAQRGAYNSILDLLYSRDGDVPDDDVTVARMIGAHWREWARLKRELITAGKIWSEGGRLCANRVQETLREAADFSQNQRRRAAERWQKYKKDNENNDEDMRPRNANTSTATPTATKKERARPSGRGTRIPDGWKPSDQGREFAEVLLGTELALTEFDKFYDYWRGLSGGRAIKSDWEATWRNWCRRASEYQGKSHGNSKSLVAAQDRLIGKLAEFNKPAPDLSGTGGVCSGEGATVVRLLPKGGRE